MWSLRGPCSSEAGAGQLRTRAFSAPRALLLP
eukprot:jgi/Astpho2/7588/gw1.00115.107.1_t